MKTPLQKNIYWTLLAIVGLTMLVNIYLALGWVRPDAEQGDIGRIFFFHVPGAWVGLVSFLVVFVASVGYLIRRTQGWDRVAVSAAELGVVFIAITLITGPIWAKVAWNVWWDWDARLTSTLVLFLLFCGYLMLRRYIAEPSSRAKLSAVVGIVSAVDVPIVYFSIRWWRTQHPQPVIGGAEGSGLGERELIAFLYSLGVFTLLYFVLLIQRVSMARLEDSVELLRRERRGSHTAAKALSWLLPLLLLGGLGEAAEAAMVPAQTAPDQGGQGQPDPLAKEREQLEIETENLIRKRQELAGKNERAIRHMMIAYATVWVLIIGYQITISRRQAKLQREIDQLS
ncbi:MAG: CcmD family protein [Planctomycetota bacterium]